MAVTSCQIESDRYFRKAQCSGAEAADYGNFGSVDQRHPAFGRTEWDDGSRCLLEVDGQLDERLLIAVLHPVRASRDRCARYLRGDNRPEVFEFGG